MLLKGLVAFILALAVLGGAAASGAAAGSLEPSAAADFRAGDTIQVAQGEQTDVESVPAPSDSDDEIRLVLALLIAVAAIALLGTFVYWVRTGDGRSGRDSSAVAAKGSASEDS